MSIPSRPGRISFADLRDRKAKDPDFVVDDWIGAWAAHVGEHLSVDPFSPPQPTRSILAALELMPVAAHHTRHVGLREIAPVIFLVCVILIVAPMISDMRANARRDRSDGDES